MRTFGDFFIKEPRGDKQNDDSGYFGGVVSGVVKNFRSLRISLREKFSVEKYGLWSGRVSSKTELEYR